VNKAVPEKQRGHDVPYSNGSYFPNADSFFFAGAYETLLGLTQHVPIDAPLSELPEDIWSTWYGKDSNGGYILGTSFVMHIEQQMQKGASHEVRKSLKAAICAIYNDFLQNAYTDAIERTAERFNTSIAIVRRAWQFRRHDQGNDLPIEVRTAANNHTKHMRQLRRNDKYPAYTKAIFRAQKKISEDHVSADPNVPNHTFGVYDLAPKDGRFPVHCPVLGIALDYYTPKPLEFNKVAVWRKDVTKGFVPENMTIMSRVAMLMIEGVYVNVGHIETYLRQDPTSYNDPFKCWEAWQDMHTTYWRPRVTNETT
jgi:uncharacterized protein (UPF0147 family)